MKALTKVEAASGAELCEREVPTPGRDEVLVRVRAAAICGTDKHIYNWDAWAASRIAIPRVFGHECCGDVVAIGRDVDSVAVGDFVSLETHFPCGTCRLCRTGSMHVCENLKILGVDTDGCFADFVVAPAICAWKNPADMDPKVAAIQEPFGNAVYCVDQANVGAKTVAILGDGPIASFAAGICKAMGASLVAVTGLSEARLAIAGAMGADRTLDVSERDAADALRDASEGEGFDVVLEMAGVQATVQAGFTALRKGGRFIAFGIPPGQVSFDYTNAIVFKEATVIGVNGRRMFETWYQTRALLTSGAVDVTPVLTHSFGFSQYADAFALINEPETVVGKAIFDPAE